jgi:PDZ domain-containing secreted protein
MRALSIAFLFSALASPLLADDTSGTVVAFDRVDRIIVLDDKTVWPLQEATEVPDDLKAGDSVRIDYVGGGAAGVTSVTSVTRSEG